MLFRSAAAVTAAYMKVDAPELEKLRKIGNLLRKLAKEGLIQKSNSGKLWLITEKGEQEFGI